MPLSIGHLSLRPYCLAFPCKEVQGRKEVNDQQNTTFVIHNLRFTIYVLFNYLAIYFSPLGSQRGAFSRPIRES